MRLAKIENLIVENIIVGDLADYPAYTDVTNIDCGIGWTDNQDGTFTDNQVPVSRRIISVDEFIDRIPLAAFESIVASPSAIASAFVVAITAMTEVNLDSPKAIYYIDKMLLAGLINQTEHDEILA